MFDIFRDILFGLLFGKSILLTPVPIDLVNMTELRLNPSIEAVTGGASLEIDVSSQVAPSRDFLDAFARVEKGFPLKTVKAELIRSDTHEVISLAYVGPTASDTKVYLKLRSLNDMPIGVKFDTLRITTEKEIKSARVYWMNFSK